MSPDSDAKDFGNLLDTLVLTPEKFDKRYVQQPSTYRNEKKEEKPWNNNANACRAWHEEQQGKQVVSHKELTAAIAAKDRLLKDDLIASFIAASDKQVLVQAQWHDDETGLTVPVRCLMDLVPRLDSEFSKTVGDLKTTRTAALQSFSRDVFKMGYHIQAAFDLDLLVAATGEDRCSWVFVIQESYPPWQTGRRLLSEDFLALGRAEYQRILGLYCRCLKAGVWPGYDDTDEAIQGWSLVAPEPWMAMHEQFSPHFTAGGDAPEATSSTSEMPS